MGPHESLILRRKTSCYAAQDMHLVEMQNMRSVESQDICLVETQDMCCVESACLVSQDSDVLAFNKAHVLCLSNAHVFCPHNSMACHLTWQTVLPWHLQIVDVFAVWREHRTLLLTCHTNICVCLTVTFPNSRLFSL